MYGGFSHSQMANIWIRSLHGDNNMEWAEFTQFIIDKVEGEHNVVESEQNKGTKVVVRFYK